MPLLGQKAGALLKIVCSVRQLASLCELDAQGCLSNKDGVFGPKGLFAAPLDLDAV
jgi:hypothetical protein